MNKINQSINQPPDLVWWVVLLYQLVHYTLPGVVELTGRGPNQ